MVGGLWKLEKLREEPSTLVEGLSTCVQDSRWVQVPPVRIPAVDFLPPLLTFLLTLLLPSLLTPLLTPLLTSLLTPLLTLLSSGKWSDDFCKSGAGPL